MSKIMRKSKKRKRNRKVEFFDSNGILIKLNPIEKPTRCYGKYQSNLIYTREHKPNDKFLHVQFNYDGFGNLK